MADAAAALPADPAAALKRAQQGRSYWQRVWERLRDDKVTLVVIGVLVALLAMVVFAPWFTVHDPYTGSVLRRLKPIGTPGHWLGTDEVGRDLWSRMVYGGRLSLLAGVVPVFLALLIGGFLGVLAGYAGGLVNSAIMRLIDVLYAFPSILLAIAITGILGAGLRNTILALTISFIPPVVRISESVTTQVRHLDFVEAARASGGATADDHALPHPQQRARADPGLRHQPDQHLHHPGGGAELPRPRRHAAERRMGADAQQSAPGAMGDAVRRRVAGSHDLHHLDVLQPDERRPAPGHGRAAVSVANGATRRREPGIAASPAASPARYWRREPDQAFPAQGRTARTGPRRSCRPSTTCPSMCTRGETLGIVGESGCGKSTTARLLMHLIPLDTGSIVFDGLAVGAAEGLSHRDLHRQMQMVFQDSYASLNPRLPVAMSIAFGPFVHGLAKSAALKRAHGAAGGGRARSRCCSPIAIRTSCPAASGSASISRARWRWSRAS